ncbi:hypothetical protein ACWDBW_38330 [Streptomyces sp. NPDC001107]
MMDPIDPSLTRSATEIVSDRLRLRTAHDTDREGLIELQTDPQVRLHLGGPRLRSAVNSGQVLGVKDASRTAGATALQWGDSLTADHLWRIVADNGSTHFNP